MTVAFEILDLWGSAEIKGYSYLSHGFAALVICVLYLAKRYYLRLVVSAPEGYYFLEI